MTCIVGLEDKYGSAFIGADSASVGGGIVTPTKLAKVFKAGPYVIGYTSSFRMGQLLQYSVGNFGRKKKDALEHLVTEFIPKIRKLLKEGGYTHIDSNKENGGCFLIGLDKQVFKVDSDFQVNSAAHGMMAVGCGEDFALGSLFSNSEMRPEDRVLQALKAAAYFSYGVCGPFNVIEVE